VNPKAILDFVKESRAEVNKVTWPDQKQTMQGTIAVVVFVIATSLFLGLTDFAIGNLLDWVLN
jgi:preprotein translocase subunit SecE